MSINKENILPYPKVNFDSSCYSVSTVRVQKQAFKTPFRPELPKGIYKGTHIEHIIYSPNFHYFHKSAHFKIIFKEWFFFLWDLLDIGEHCVQNVSNFLTGWELPRNRSHTHHNMSPLWFLMKKTLSLPVWVYFDKL